jgi:hypothetical protein
MVVGNYRWMAKQINLSACLEAADPIMQGAGIGIDIVGEGAELPSPINVTDSGGHERLGEPGGVYLVTRR